MRFITFILFISYCSIEAQNPYNTRLENGQIQALGHLIYELEDSYLGIGRGIDTIDFRRGIFATEFDKDSGEVINTSKITMPNSILSFANNNTVYEINEKPHFIFSRSDTIYLTSYSELVKELTIEKKIFSAVPTSSLFIYDFKKNGDDIYILASHSDDHHNLVVFKYNLINDSVSEIFLSDDLGFMYTAKMSSIDNGNILVTYRVFIENIATQVVIEVDTEGNTLWKYVHDVPFENFSFSFIPVGQGEYFIGGGKARLIPSDPEGEGVPFLMKFNYTEKRIVASSDFNIPNDEWFIWNSGVNEIVPTHDSTAYTCVAQLYEFPLNVDTLQTFGMIAKVDRELNVVWRRSYARLVGDYVDNDLNDIIATSDGNYLAYGTSIKTSGNFPEDIPALSWAIKLDDDGKIIGDTTSTSIEWVDEDYYSQIEVFPNPATEVLYINQDDVNKVTYSVYNTEGQLEDKFTLSGSFQSVTKSITNWSNGHKIIVMSRMLKIIGNTRIVKQ